MSDPVPVAVVDGHNDLPWTLRTRRASSVEGLDSGLPPEEAQTDLPRLRAGGVAAQFWSVWVDSVVSGPEVVTATLEQIDVVHRMAARHPETLRLTRTAAETRAAIAAGRIASLLGVEGGHQIENSLAVLRAYARLGVRYLTLTWTASHDWADSATGEPTHGGLSPFGREVVAELNRIGVLVDLAHVSVATAHDALDVSRAPVIVSHSCAGALNPHPRNLPDDVVRRVAEGGGVYQVTFVPDFLSREHHVWSRTGRSGPAPRVDASTVADHVEHLCSVAGVSGVGIGGDYDGSPDMPRDLPDVAAYPVLFAELRRRGWSEADLRLLGGENVLRVLESADPAWTAFVRAGSGGSV
ncbi:dipeptidase [Kineococcus gynurae]|uniref:Dipeptidase n=1 Tax=Kineococcus gynurae TaxID=452979 RepID=A0ABV5LQW1_9ACTN